MRISSSDAYTIAQRLTGGSNRSAKRLLSRAGDEIIWIFGESVAFVKKDKGYNLVPIWNKIA